MMMTRTWDLVVTDLLCHISLSTQPGSSAFTRIDRDAISRHSARVKPTAKKKRRISISKVGMLSYSVADFAKGSGTRL